MFLIIYDISGDVLRNKVSKLLVQEGYERIQFSVFVGALNPYKNKVWQKLNLYMQNNKEDSIICIRLKLFDFLNMKILGKFTKDVEHLAGTKKTKII